MQESPDGGKLFQSVVERDTKSLVLKYAPKWQSHFKQERKSLRIPAFQPNGPDIGRVAKILSHH